MKKAVVPNHRGEDSPDPDRQQRDASDPTHSVWVGASAGSGKTTVLVKRVLRLLLTGVQPQKILCITFTRAAAAHMSIKVMENLSHWATCSDEELREDIDLLQNAPSKPDQLVRARRLFATILACPGGMRIRTIHAFCQEILRRFPIEARLPPHFALIEDADSHVMLEEVKAALLTEAGEHPATDLGQALRFAVQDLGEHGFENAMRTVLNERARIKDAVTQFGGLKKLGARIRSLFALAPGDTIEKFCRNAVDRSNLLEADLRRAATLLGEGSKRYAARGQEMRRWLELSTSDRVQSIENWCGCFFTDKGAVYADFGDKKLLEKYPELDGVLRSEASRLQVFKERMAAAQIAEGTLAVLTLGSELLRLFDEHKREKGFLDYDDLVLSTERLLRRAGIAPWVLYKLDGGIDHILVDEAQDTSRAQWNIVRAITEEFFAGSGAQPHVNRTLFVVGDEKQSIFSFQHADPAAFGENRDYFRDQVLAAKKLWREVPQHVSFRSAPAVLRAVDAVFSDPEARQGVSHEPVQHFAIKKEKRGRVEVWPLIPSAEKDKNAEWELPLVYEAERDPQAEMAAVIAKHIRGWIVRKEKLPGHQRPIAPGDIMILLRRRKKFADLMVRALKQADVPVTGVDRMYLLKQLPVMDVCALIQFTLLPDDELNLAALLRGPLLNFSEDELMALAMKREGTLWQSLTAKTISNKIFAAAHEYLAYWLGQADRLTPYAMVAQILNRPCPGNIVSGRRALWSRLGPDALDPIDELLNAAQEFGHTHTPSLQAFLHWLSATETEIKRELDRGGGQVRIMTVHAAKGLEAPIVFLPDTSSIPRSNEMPKLLWSERGIPLYLPRTPQTAVARDLWNAARERQMQEYRRLFYVALTRAEDRLYIGGWAPARGEGDAATQSWHALAYKALAPLHEAVALSKEDSPDILAIMDHGPPPVLKEKPFKSALRKTALPTWAFEPAPSEHVVRPVREAAAASPDIQFARGLIIHRLLQSLPDIEDEKRGAVAVRYLASPQHNLSKESQQEIASEVLKLLRHPDYTPLFAPASRAEVAVAGVVEGKPFSKQVDRFCVKGESVWIVDYKSNRPPPKRLEDVPLDYRKQLAGYKSLLGAIYPDKTIRCFLLWTYTPLLMEIPPSLLAEA